MEVIDTELEKVKLIRPPTIFEDFRGSYVEVYNEKAYRKNGIDVKFIQDDVSISHRGVLRGIHGDQVTTKLVTCLLGRIYLVVVNNDSTSPQYRQWVSFTLSDSNRLQVLVPPKFGVAHLVLSEVAVFHYKQSTYYDRESQFTLRWNDERLNIYWPVKDPILSRRDSGVG
jgi:dTDP-4-dehydrorhamnose 3,5-epimerase